MPLAPSSAGCAVSLQVARSAQAPWAHRNIVDKKGQAECSQDRKQRGWANLNTTCYLLNEWVPLGLLPPHALQRKVPIPSQEFLLTIPPLSALLCWAPNSNPGARFFFCGGAILLLFLFLFF